MRPCQIRNRKVVQIRSDEHGRLGAFGVVHKDAVTCSYGPDALVLLVHLSALGGNARSSLEQHGTAAGDNTGFLAAWKGGNRLELPVEDIGAEGEGIRARPLELTRGNDKKAAIRRPRHAAELASILKVGKK